MDRFEYAVGRSDPNAANLFVQNGWSGAKTQQTTNGAHGWVYTATSIPGYSGAFPGTNSSRVLVLEAGPRAFPPVMVGDVAVYQTDFYLQYGHGGSSAYDNTIPGDVWFQFWMYPLHGVDGATSTFDGRMKFFYACNTDYPCHTHKWMVMSTPGADTGDPNNITPFGNPSQGQFFWLLQRASGVSEIINTNGDPYTQSAIGSKPTEWMRPNRWTLVRMHFDTTHTTGNSWEVWLRPYGGSWRKVAEWLGGRTPGFTWNIPSQYVGGHRVLRMPTTVGYDYRLYMDDFVMSTTAEDLPAYADEGPGGGITAPGAPANLRIIRTVAAFFDRAVAFLRDPS